MSGIYGITNLVTGKVYVGKATSPKNRFCRHRYLLNSNNHWNQYLQSSWKKHGKNVFEFKMLEECAVDQLPLREQAWIDKLSPNVYNLDKNVANKRQDKNPFFGKKHTDAAKEKMATAKIGKYFGQDNPNYGKTVSPETKLKMSINRATKLNVESVLEIKRQLSLGYKHQYIDDQFKVSRTVITRIGTGNRWKHVELGKGE